MSGVADALCAVASLVLCGCCLLQPAQGSPIELRDCRVSQVASIQGGFI
jgi:hypothetical protein